MKTIIQPETAKTSLREIMMVSLFPKLLQKHYLLPLAGQQSRRPQAPSPSMKTIAMNELRSPINILHQQQN